MALKTILLMDENWEIYSGRENGGAKLDHGSGGEVLLRAA